MMEYTKALEDHIKALEAAVKERHDRQIELEMQLEEKDDKL